MKKEKINRVSLVIGVAGIMALAGSAYFSWQVATKNIRVAAAANESPGSGVEANKEQVCRKGEKEHGQGNENEAEQSDLDRPVDEMWAAVCEHKIPMYKCGECRYEIGVVKLSPALFGENKMPGIVKAIHAETKLFGDVLSVNGEVKLNEKGTVHVSAPWPGVIKHVAVDVGSRVGAGDLILEIDSHEITEAKADYINKTTSFILARKTADRERVLFEKKISAAIEVQEAEAREAEANVEAATARARLIRMGVSNTDIDKLLKSSPPDLSGTLQVRAPSHGVVLERHAVAGEYLEPHREVVLIADLSKIWVWANLSEPDVQAVTRAGGHTDAEVESTTAGNHKLHRGILDLVAGTMDQESRTIRGRIILENALGELRPGMFVNVRLKLPGGRSSVAIPKTAILSDGGRSFVFTHKEADYWIRRPVIVEKTPGNRGNDVEVIDGIKPGQTIIADGSFVLKSDVLRSKMGAGCAD